MYTSSVLIYALAAATSVLSSPAPAPVVKRAPEPKIMYLKDFAQPTSSPSMEKRTISECQAVVFVVDALKVVSKAAYPFCSSFISIPVVTSTVSATTTVTPSPVSTTSTVTPAQVSITSTTTVTDTVSSGTSTFYSHYTPTPSAAKEKRGGGSLPPYVSAFGSAQVSKACSCLSISPSTTTVSTTVGTTLPAITITATATAATPTTTITSTTTTTTTVPAAVSTVPALCAPANLLLTSGALESSGNDEPTLVTKSTITDIGSCCAACLATTNCLSYDIYSSSCRLFVAVDPSTPNQGNAAQNAICPLGVNGQDTIFPPGVSSPESGDAAFHVGPCLVDATPLI